MYYPLLRARQFELISLRELANSRITQGLILPILEPVKESHNNISLATRVFEETAQDIFLIVNPIVGDVKGDTILHLSLLKNLQSPNIRAAFYYRNNIDYIIQSINTWGLKKCLILCSDDTSVDDHKFQEFIGNDNISTISAESSTRNRHLHRFFSSLGKGYIKMDDFFEKQTNNSAFLDIHEHRFSEEHIYFLDEGFTGFGDYTVLPIEYVDGGSTPRAVVIHLTYEKPDGSIWIRHFTSNTNDSIANVQGKFAEAAYKAVEFCKARMLTNDAIEELMEYYDTQHYPGLGTVKKISIKNHLIVVANYLRKH